MIPPPLQKLPFSPAKIRYLDANSHISFNFLGGVLRITTRNPKKEMPTPFTTWFWRGIPSWDLQMPLGSCPILPWNFGLIGWIKDMEKAGIILFLKAPFKKTEATSRFHVEFQFSNKTEEIISKWMRLMEHYCHKFHMFPQGFSQCHDTYPEYSLKISMKKNHWDIHSWIPPL